MLATNSAHHNQLIFATFSPIKIHNCCSDTQFTLLRQQSMTAFTRNNDFLFSSLASDISCRIWEQHCFTLWKFNFANLNAYIFMVKVFATRVIKFRSLQLICLLKLCGRDNILHYCIICMSGLSGDIILWLFDALFGTFYSIGKISCIMPLYHPILCCTFKYFGKKMQ